MSVDVLVVTGSEDSAAGAVSRALETLPSPSETPFYQSANLWWPEDRAWCVATEIDFVSTYVAGSQRLMDALLGCKAIEAYRVEPSDGTSYDGDAVNPKPKDRAAFEFSFRLE